MERILVQITELQNLTAEPIGFEVAGRLFRLKPLPPGETLKVNQWEILELCRKYDCNELKARIMIGSEFSGIEICARQLLVYARIMIQPEMIGDQLYVPCLKAVREEDNDWWLRLKWLKHTRNKHWSKRPCIEIGRADHKWARSLSGERLEPTTNQGVIDHEPVAMSSQVVIDHEPVAMSSRGAIDEGSLDATKQEINETKAIAVKPDGGLALEGAKRSRGNQEEDQDRDQLVNPVAEVEMGDSSMTGSDHDNLGKKGKQVGFPVRRPNRRMKRIAYARPMREPLIQRRRVIENLEIALMVALVAFLSILSIALLFILFKFSK